MFKTPMDKLFSISTLTVGMKQNKVMEMAEFSLLSGISFFIPFLMADQLLAGTFVNMSLIGGSLYMKGRNLLPLIILPSLGMLSRGILFGPLTFYILYMLPFIWLGNASLIMSMKLLHLKMKRSYFVSALAGSFIKFSILISAALTLYNLRIIPAEFLVAMGILQLTTAVSASFVFFPIKRIQSKN